MNAIEPKVILVPTDFSPHAAQALHYAAALGERFGAHLLVIYADTFLPPVDLTINAAGAFTLPREEMILAANEQLLTFARKHVRAAVACDVRVIVSNPAEAIDSQARASGANLIIMGTHGRTGLRRLLVGSVTESVMRTAAAPVIAVHESEPKASAVRVIIGRGSSSPQAAAAVAYAGMLANIDDARYVEVAEQDDVLAVARNEGADLIALGIDGDRSFGEMLVGTAVERVVQHSICPVLTVNPLAARALARGERALARAAH